MALDYSKLSDEELQAIADNDFSKLSDATLQAMAAQEPEPTMTQQAGKVAGGVLGTAYDLGKAAYEAVPYKELVLPYAGYKALPHVVEGVKQGARTIGNFVGGATTGSAPVSPYPAGATASPSWTAPAAQAQQPSVMQRGMDIAAKMREIAANRVVGFGTSGAAVPAAVGAGGAAATGLAGGQMRAMTPQQRKGFYDNPMLGAMGGDAGLAAAIMNRGQ